MVGAAHAEDNPLDDPQFKMAIAAVIERTHATVDKTHRDFPLSGHFYLVPPIKGATAEVICSDKSFTPTFETRWLFETPPWEWSILAAQGGAAVTGKNEGEILLAIEQCQGEALKHKNGTADITREGVWITCQPTILDIFTPTEADLPVERELRVEDGGACKDTVATVIEKTGARLDISGEVLPAAAVIDLAPPIPSASARVICYGKLYTPAFSALWGGGQTPPHEWFAFAAKGGSVITGLPFEEVLSEIEACQHKALSESNGSAEIKKKAITVWCEEYEDSGYDLAFQQKGFDVRIDTPATAGLKDPAVQ
jgi:hypothetical protein